MRSLDRRVRTYLPLTVSLLLLPAACDNKFNLGGLDFSDVPYFTMSGTIENSEGVATIKEFVVIVDGITLRRTTLQAPAVRLSISEQHYVSDEGEHRLALVVADQTTTPNLYVVNGITVTYFASGASGSATRTLTLSPRTVRLGNGDAITYTFRI